MCLAFWKKNRRLSSRGLPIFYEMKSHKASDDTIVEMATKSIMKERATSGNATQREIRDAGLHLQRRFTNVTEEIYL
ncbi:hypothetical protein CEXT_347091 [Caerostris extrusa]|uniref:Uncharacterized protein n=1 Tax=Caerostris extrusa TaxID=172846 RepID=A0AAV4VKE8_CAEEX|nr:hypothetical protein CEXT_347091 [Caerostris extrusa]